MLKATCFSYVSRRVASPKNCPLLRKQLDLRASLALFLRNGYFFGQHCSTALVLHRKEVIQPHLPIRLPCYDFTPIANPTFGSVLLAVRLLTSGITGSHGVTGGVYKARERIHRGMLIRDY